MYVEANISVQYIDLSLNIDGLPLSRSRVGQKIILNKNCIRIKDRKFIRKSANKNFQNYLLFEAP